VRSTSMARTGFPGTGSKTYASPRLLGSRCRNVRSSMAWGPSRLRRASNERSRSVRKSGPGMRLTCRAYLENYGVTERHVPAKRCQTFSGACLGPGVVTEDRRTGIVRKYHREWQGVKRISCTRTCCRAGPERDTMEYTPDLLGAVLAVHSVHGRWASQGKYQAPRLGQASIGMATGSYPGQGHSEPRSL